MKVTPRFVCSWFLGAAVLVAALLGPAALAADAPKAQNSPKAGKIIKEAHDDLNAKKFSDAITKLKEAEGTAGKNAYDQHLINDMLGYAYVHTNDMADAAKSWEAEIDDAFTSPAEQQQRIRALSEIYYQLKTYDKAVEFGQRALKGGFGDANTSKIVGQSYYLKGDWKNTMHFEEAQVDAAVKAGSNPSKESLELVLSSCVKLDDGACITKTLEKLVTYYPKPEYWYQLLYTLIKDTANSDTNTLQVYRLMLETDVLKNAEDFIEMANLAMDAGSPGEAQRALQRGFEKNIFSDQRNKDKAQRLLDKAKTKSGTDQPTLDKAAKEADTAPTGTKNAAMGVAYLGYGQYDKAVDQFSKATSKGQLKNAAETQLDLGIAQLKAGHKDDAVKSFKAVKGDPVLERLGTLWALHAKEK